MFTRLAHICLNVQNLQRSLEFYTRLGFRPRFDFTRKGKPFGAYLEISENQFLEIFEDPNVAKSIPTGLAHFCLESADLQATTAELTKRGIAYTPNKLGCDHTYQVWLEDPDGNKFEIHQYTSRSLQKCGGTVEADW